jgi:DNA-binding transcriptional LysR family regulator
MQNISVKKMSVFVSAAETGTFTDGARQANISQPAAVSIIDEIEQTVGDDLFVRAGKTRRAKLTNRGKEVYEVLARALSSYNQALDSINPNKRKHVMKTVLIQSPYTNEISPDWLQCLMAEFKDNQFSIRSAEWQQIMEAFDNQEDCIALIDGEVRPKNRDYFQLDTFELCLVVPDFGNCHPLENGSIAWEDVPENTVIYSGINPGAIMRVCENLKRSGADAKQFTKINCPDILQGFINNFHCPVIIPKAMIETLQVGCRLNVLEFAHSRIHIPVGLTLPYGLLGRLKMTTKELRQILGRKPALMQSPPVMASANA